MRANIDQNEIKPYRPYIHGQTTMPQTLSKRD